MVDQFVPLLLMIVMAIGLALMLLKLGEWVGPKRGNRIKTAPYESGMDPIGTARDRYSVKFYLVAMIFIVFDVEVVFLYPWAVSFWDYIRAGIGLEVLGIVLVFIAILTVGLIYDIKKGGLDFYS